MIYALQINFNLFNALKYRLLWLFWQGLEKHQASLSPNWIHCTPLKIINYIFMQNNLHRLVLQKIEVYNIGIWSECKVINKI